MRRDILEDLKKVPFRHLVANTSLKPKQNLIDGLLQLLLERHDCGSSDINNIIKWLFTFITPLKALKQVLFSGYCVDGNLQYSCNS